MLLAVTRDGAWEEWVLFMLRAVEETAAWTTERIGAIRTLMADTARYAKRKVPRHSSRELIDVTFVQPYRRIRNLVEAGIAERQTASAYLKKHAEAGILDELKVGRERLFINSRLMRLLTLERPGDLSFPA